MAAQRPPHGPRRRRKQRRGGPAVNKRAIVAESRRPAKAAAAAGDSVRAPHPLEGAKFVIGAAQASQLPPPGVPEIAFAGRSNAGQIERDQRAREPDQARVREPDARPHPADQSLFALRSGALVADLPGYGYAAVAKSVKREWQDFLWHYVTTRSSLVALVLVVDSRHGLKELDRDVLSEFVRSGRPVRILATKADKLNTTEQRAAVALIAEQLGVAFPLGAPNVTTQLFSAATRQGVPEAESAIASWIPTAAWQNEPGGGPTKERPRGQGE